MKKKKKKIISRIKAFAVINLDAEDSQNLIDLLDELTAPKKNKNKDHERQNI